MNLEMEGGTEALAAVAEAATPRELERQPYDDFDIAVIRALQGPMEVGRAPVRRGRRRGRAARSSDFLAHLEGMVERKLLRRVAAILFHRRAGFSANGMGVWKVPDERSSRSALGWRRSAGSPTATSGRRTRTGPTRSSRWPTAARRRSATRSCSRSPTSTASTARTAAILYSSTEFKKIRLHYFTDEYADWEREHAGA